MGIETGMERTVRTIYMTYGAMVTPLGNTPEDNFQSMSLGNSGVQKQSASGFNGEDWPLGKIESLHSDNRYTELLRNTCNALKAKHGQQLFQSEKTLIIISSTKADIESLPEDTFTSTRKIIQEVLSPKNAPLIISNACISGVLAINTAADYIKAGKFDTVVSIGIDVLTDFIVFGFQSLFALSDQPSKPFDKNRTGISIGEAAGAIIVSSVPPDSDKFYVEYLGGSSSNDANHISGPSRTGEGLFRSINRTAKRANINLKDLNFISAHGTGTLYNDEMESIAFDRLGLNNIPLNSLKGYFGHTLGAAGIIEILSTMLMMENNILLKSPGYDEQGTSCKLNVVRENTKSDVQLALKTASGFGGGNASIIIKKKV